MQIIQDYIYKGLNNHKFISELLQWCIDNWSNMAMLMQKQICYEISNDFNEMQLLESGEPLFVQCKESVKLIPLHHFLSNEELDQISGCIISFGTNSSLAPNSKVCFYSDPVGINKLAEITSGKGGRGNLHPICLNHNKVWCYFNIGNTYSNQQTSNAG